MLQLRRALPFIWSAVLAVVLLGPALKPGYILTYDMVWVPDLALRSDFFGAGTGLPRAVPSDAVVAVLDQLLGGMLLQKIVLLGCLIGGGIGSLRLAPAESLTGRLVAVTLYQWNPFVAERLLIGHWPVLVGYAVLPWLVDAARRWRTEGRMPAALWLLIPLGSLSAGAGLVTGVAIVAFAATRDARRFLALAGLVLGANAPWLVAGALHVANATTDAAGATAFALHGEGSLPAPLAAVGLGGIWNAEVVPSSRTGVMGWLALFLIVALALVGRRSWATHVVRRDTLAFITCWGIGWGLAVLTWLAPDAMAWLFSQVPGVGLIRDGARILALCVPLTVAVASHGAARVVDRIPSANRPAIALALVLLPIVALPDIAFGLSGQLRPTEFPKGYTQVRDAIAKRDRAPGDQGDVLVLPLTSYRQPTWNGGRKVLDPTGRYLTPDYVASDVLVVSGTSISGEDPRVQRAAQALDEPTSSLRAQALGNLGIGFIVVDATRPASPGVAGDVIADGPGLRAQVVDAAVRSASVPASWRINLTVAWTVFMGIALIGAGVTARNLHRCIAKMRRNEVGAATVSMCPREGPEC